MVANASTVCFQAGASDQEQRQEQPSLCAVQHAAVDQTSLQQISFGTGES